MSSSALETVVRIGASVVTGLFLAHEIHKASIEEWQKSDELHQAFEKFHDKHAREPKEEISKAMKIHDEFMTEIRNHFQGRGICQKLEYTGSSYEGVKVKKNFEDCDLEFDVMMIIAKHKYKLEPDCDIRQPGYAQLKLIENQKPEPGLSSVLDDKKLFGIFTVDHIVNSEKTANVFFGELQKLVNSSATMNGRVKLIKHGPAVQMDVYQTAYQKIPWRYQSRSFSVDIVPAYEIGTHMYVAKPIKGEKAKNTTTWRLSYSVQEKEKLTGGAKNVLRVLKVVRNREPGLDPLTSYHLKTALFYEMDAEDDWSRRCLVTRFFGVLKRLEDGLFSENLPHYFIKDMNILSNISPTCLSNMYNRIYRLRTNKERILNILNS